MPAAVWVMALAVAALRALPFLQLVWTRPPRGTAYLPVGYYPPDFLAYVALIRQTRDSGQLLLANPFTTEPQDGRFVLLFHQALGFLHAATGVDPFWLLELSRVPLLLLFFAVLWRFLGRILPARQERLCAVSLVAFAGGLEHLALPLAHALLPARIAQSMDHDCWQLFGWSGFGSFYNPVWIASLILFLVTLRPLVQPGGPAGRRDYAQAAVGFVLLALTHPYSASLVGAVLAGVLVAELALEFSSGWQRLPRLVLALTPAVIVLAAISAWQLRDAVFRNVSANALAPFAPIIFWAPLTCGLLAFFALRGLQQLAREQHPWAIALGGWLAGVALFSSSTLLSGYHFVYGLWLPLSIAAAPSLVATARRWRGEGTAGRSRLAVTAVLLFLTPPILTIRAMAEAREQSLVPLVYLQVLDDLRAAPPTRVIAPPKLGSLVPAFTQDRVWIGHSFMTPDFEARSRWYALLVEQPEAQAGILRSLVDLHHIGALVVPSPIVPRLVPLLAARVERSVARGPLTTVFLRDAEPPASR